jgi:hypothetical protein
MTTHRHHKGAKKATHKSVRTHRAKVAKVHKAAKPKAGHFTVGTKEVFGAWRTHLTVV